MSNPSGISITTAHSHLYRLKKFFLDWTKGRSSDREFSSLAAIEIEESLKVLDFLISKSME